MYDTIKNSKVDRDALDTSFQITKLIKISPKREAMFDQLKKDLTPDCPCIRVLCPTRWTVKAQSLKMTLTVLQKMRSNEEYDLFWSSMLKMISVLM